MQKTKIAILRGGKYMHDESLRSGAHAIQALSKYPEEIELIDVVIDSSGDWYERGVPSDAHRIFPKADYYLDLTRDVDGAHHDLAKDINIKQILRVDDRHLSTRTNIKRLTEQVLKNIKYLKVSHPKYKLLKNLNTHKEDLKNLWQTFHTPITIKDNLDNERKSLLTHSFLEALNITESILQSGGEALIEEHALGRYVSIAIVPDYRGEEAYIPIMIESINKDAKDRRIDHVDMGEITLKEKYTLSHSHHKRVFEHKDQELKSKLKRLGRDIYGSLALSSHILLDLAISGDGKIIKIIDIHIDPHLFEGSRFAECLSHSGVSLGRYILDQIEKERERSLSF